MKNYLLIALLFLSGSLCAQQSNLDSLLKVLPNAKDDTAKVWLYIAIGNEYEYDDARTAEKYYLLARDLSNKLQYKRGTIKYISNHTQILNERGLYDSSLVLNRKALHIAKEINDKVATAKVYANIGNNFNYLEQFDSCSFYYETAKKCFEDMHDKYFVARMNDLLQNIFFKLNEREKGVPYGKAAVQYFRAEGKEIELGQALLNLANNYSAIANGDSSLASYMEALKIADKTGFKSLKLSCLIGIGNIFFHRHNADSMLPYHSAALKLSREMENIEGEAIANRGMAFYYLLKNNVGAAKEYIEVSLAIADSFDLKNEKYEGIKVMANILFAMHDMVGAEQYLDSAGRIEDELRSEEIRNRVLFLEKKFETEKKEAQIALQQSQLKQKSILNYVLLVSIAAICIIMLLIYRNYRQRQKLQQQRINELETEKQLTATEAILKGEEKERSRLAQDLHDGLGGMLSGIKYSLNNMKENLIMTPGNAQAFEHSIYMLDNSISEMRRVAHNLMPENLLKFGLAAALQDYCSEMQLSGMLQVSFQAIGIKDKSIDQSLSVTVYRVTQELLNNIVKHSGATQAIVQVGATDKQLTITVEDNGKGLASETISTSQGIGWKNINSRVQYHKGSINVQSEPNKGTSIFIEFPLI